MKALITIAALMLTSAPAMAQESFASIIERARATSAQEAAAGIPGTKGEAQPQSEAMVQITAARACLTDNATKLATATKESAGDLAEIIAARCNDGTIERRAALRVLPVRAMVMDAVVKARTGV